MKIKIIKTGEQYPILGNILIGLITISLIILLIINTFPQLENNVIVTVLGATIFIPFIISLFLKNSVVPIGFFFMEDEYLCLIENDITTRFNIQSIQKLHLRYHGYKGVLFAGGTIFRPSEVDGSDNILSFEFEGKKYRIELVLQNKQEKEYLFQVIKKYNGKIKNYNVIYTLPDWFKFRQWKNNVKIDTELLTTQK